MEIVFFLLLAGFAQCKLNLFSLDDVLHQDSESISKRIYNGYEIDITQAPYMAVVEADKSFMSSYPFATAVIITNRYLLSAASFFYIQRGKTMRAYLGTKNINSAQPENIYEVEEVTIHYKFINDIALIKLKNEIEFNAFHRPIAFYSKPKKFKHHLAKFMVLGYGLHDEIERNDTLGILTMRYQRNYTNDIPIYAMRFTISLKSHLCPGDHGSPLVLDNKLIGLAVTANGCKNNTVNKVTFVGVNYFRNWISSHVGFQNLSHAAASTFDVTN